MESMSASLEAEQKAKGEALRVKKALEGEINELEIGLDHANKANSEGLKSIKRYQAQLKETIQLYEDEARSRSQIMEQVRLFGYSDHSFEIQICNLRSASLSARPPPSPASWRSPRL